MKLVPLIWLIGSLIWVVSASVRYSNGEVSQGVVHSCCAAMYIGIAAMYYMLGKKA